MTKDFEQGYLKCIDDMSAFVNMAIESYRKELNTRARVLEAIRSWIDLLRTDKEFREEVMRVGLDYDEVKWGTVMDTETGEIYRDPGAEVEGEVNGD